MLIESLALSESIAVRSYQVLATSRRCANGALAGDWKSAYTYALEAVAVRKDNETSLLFIDFIRYFDSEVLELPRRTCSTARVRTWTSIAMQVVAYALQRKGDAYSRGFRPPLLALIEG